MSANDVSLTPEELVARWKGAVTVETLSNWRSQKKGPTYIKFGRSIRYPMRHVIAFEQANERASGGPVSASAA